MILQQVSSAHKLFVMKVLIFLLICLSSLSLYSQSIEVFGGANRNLFYGANDGAHFNSTYHPGNGFSAGVGIDSVKLDWLTLRFTVQFDRYSGEFSVSDGGQGGGFSTTANIEKSVVSLGAFPLNFSLGKRLNINLGAEVSRLVDESFSGTVDSWRMVLDPPGSPVESESQDMNALYDRFSSRTCFGLKARLAYDIALTKRLCLVPQYAYYLGLSKEFKEFPEVTKSMRHHLCLGIKWK